MVYKFTIFFSRRYLLERFFSRNQYFATKVYKGTIQNIYQEDKDPKQ